MVGIGMLSLYHTRNESRNESRNEQLSVRGWPTWAYMTGLREAAGKGRARNMTHTVSLYQETDQFDGPGTFYNTYSQPIVGTMHG